MILLAAGGVYAAACQWLHTRWSSWAHPTKRQVVGFIVVGGLGLRLLLLAVPPSLSDDIYRYRWDGKVQSAGLNPYLEPPASPSLAEHRDPLWQEINYPTIRTIYPPLAQWLFRLTYSAHDGLISYQILAVVGDLLATLALIGCLMTWKLPKWRVALWAWNPLAAVEIASSGHFDAWPIAALLVAALAVARSRPGQATGALAAGTLLKTWPLVGVPLLLARRRPWHAVAVGALVAAAYLPYLGAGLGILQPWMDYTGRWLFNDAGFAVLRLVTGSQPVAKAVAAAICFFALWQFWSRGVDPVRGTYWLLCLMLMLTPAIHPWYLLWPLPLAAMALDVGWIALTVLAPLAYWILAVNTGDSDLWIEPWWPRLLVYLPALALWAAQSRRHGVPAPPPLLVGDSRGVT